MKFQVSVLSDKGMKKVIATVDADYFDERTSRDREAFLSLNQTRVKFYVDGGWFKDMVVSSLLLSSSYVIEQVSL